MTIKKLLRQKLSGNEFGKTLWSFLHSVNVQVQRVIPDRKYFENVYYRNSGKKLNFDNPDTFDAKQLWIKMFYRDPLYTKCTDKYLVREYVKEAGLAHILNPLYEVYDDVKDIKWSLLPKAFYLKANHTSAGNIRCNDIDTFDKNRAVKTLRKVLRHNHYYDSREWNYKDIQPKIIAESIIESAGEEPLVDYRFLCYSGKCEYLFIDICTADENGNHREDAARNVYDRDMNLLDVTVTRKRFVPTLIQKPSNYDKMVEYADILSRPFPFCRVDLYNVDGKILFGELTFFHSGGLSKIEPEQWQYELGKDIPIDLLRQGLWKPVK